MIAGRHIDLRPVERDDLVFLHRLHNDPVTAGSVVDWSLPVSAAQQSAWYDRLGTDASSLRLTIVERSTGDPVGLTGVWNMDHRNGTGWTGIKMASESGGRGLATDAVMATMAWAFAFSELRRLEGAILDFNAASHALYVRRCGWVVEGRERQKILRGGRYCDLYRVAILRDEFDALPDAMEYVNRVFPVDTQVQTSQE
jgi:RimJ/RimL family protein N-acetyltransferase